MRHAKQFGVDYLSVYSVQDIERLPQTLRPPLLKGWERTFFQLMSEIELQSLDLSFSKQARIKILEENLIEVRGLISRSLLPVYDANGELAWIIDGIILLNGSTWLVDSIRDLVYPVSTLPEGGIGTVTLFLEDIRVSTNVPLDTAMNQGRAIGTRVSEQVKTHVLEGEVWINRAFVHDAWYISAYKPIRDFNNRVIGMLYTGFLEWPLMRGYIQNMIELGIVILVILVIFGFYISRAFNDFFAPLDKIQRVVRLVRF